MTKFNVALLPPAVVVVGNHSATHQAFTILLDNKQVGSGLNVEMPDGRRFIRIFDYDVPLRADLLAYFGSRKGVSECTFSRPYNG